MEKIKVSKEITLRHVRLEDASVFFEMEQDEEARKNFMSTPGSVKKVEEDIMEEIEQYREEKPKSEKFAIEFNGEVVGSISINQLNIPFFEHRAKIDFCLHPKFRGKGITTEVVKVIVKYAFEKYKLMRLEAWCRTFNKATQKVLEKSGFKLEGVLRKNKCKEGEYLDDMVWAIVK